MSVAERIRICRLLELMNSQKEFSKEVGLKDASRFLTDREEKKERGNK